MRSVARQDGGLQRLMLLPGLSDPSRLALMTLGRQLPASSLPLLDAASLPHLMSLPADAPAQEYGPVLECLFAWGRGPDVLACIRAGVEVRRTKRVRRQFREARARREAGGREGSKREERRE
jgi:hypothetical protein